MTADSVRALRFASNQSETPQHCDADQEDTASSAASRNPSMDRVIMAPPSAATHVSVNAIEPSHNCSPTPSQWAERAARAPMYDKGIQAGRGHSQFNIVNVPFLSSLVRPSSGR